MLDATTDAVVTQIKLPGGPELALWDPFDDTIHQNLAKNNQQAVIDPTTDTIKVVFNLPPGCTPKGAAIDPTDQHIIVGCGGAMTVIMDGGNGAILSVSNNVGGSDAVAYNAIDHRFYTASSGNKVAGKAAPALSAFDAATNMWLANVPTDTSVHTLAVDPATGRVYLASQKTGTLLVYAAGASVTQLP